MKRGVVNPDALTVLSAGLRCAPRPASWLKPERRGQHLFHGLDRLNMSRFVVGNGGAALDTRVVEVERAAGLAVHNATRGSLLEETASRGLRLRKMHGRLQGEGIESMMGIGILVELHVLAAALQPRHVPTARLDRDIVVRDPVKEANRPIADGLVVEVFEIARCVER